MSSKQRILTIEWFDARKQPVPLRMLSDNLPQVTDEERVLRIKIHGVVTSDAAAKNGTNRPRTNVRALRRGNPHGQAMVELRKRLFTRKSSENFSGRVDKRGDDFLHRIRCYERRWCEARVENETARPGWRGEQESEEIE